MVYYDTMAWGSVQVVKLIRYAFESTTERDNENDMDDLMALVAGFVACRSADLLGCAEFRALVMEGGRISLNVMEMMSKEILLV